MSDLHISWDEYHYLIEQLAVKIYQSNWQFNQIVCLARGGLGIGNIFSRLFKQPLAILAARSYSGENERSRGKLIFARDLTMTTNKLGSHILLVDDLADSGTTLQNTITWLKAHYTTDIKEIQTAVIWCKGSSIFSPDYYVQYLPDNPWIHQPFEKYELINIEELVYNNSSSREV
ncbi:MAG TPA: phosphoribosyltransferase family protein [Allocoleopsis sp.]